MTFNQMRKHIKADITWAKRWNSPLIDYYKPELILLNKCEKMVLNKINIELQRFKCFKEKGIDFIMHTNDMIEFLQEQKKRITGAKNSSSFSTSKSKGFKGKK